MRTETGFLGYFGFEAKKTALIYVGWANICPPVKSILLGGKYGLLPPPCSDIVGKNFANHPRSGDRRFT